MPAVDLEQGMLQRIEDAIVERLKTVQALKTVAGYEGELDRDNLAALLPQFPAAYLVLDGGQLRRVEAHRLEARPLSLTVLICTSSVRSRADRRADAFALIDEIIKVLFDTPLDLDITPLAPTSLDLVLTTQAVTAYGLGLVTSFDFPAPA